MHESDPDSLHLTAEKAEFIEKNTNVYLQYTMDCFDNVRREGNNVLQWLFGVITGGMAVIGTLISLELYHVAVGAGLAIAVASFAAAKLVTDLCSKDTMPPGNYFSSLSTMLSDSIDVMRYREASGVDQRIAHNLNVVAEVATAVDKARSRFACIPRWFIGGVVVAFAIDYFFVMP